jgi:hypothetical protein
MLRDANRIEAEADALLVIESDPQIALGEAVPPVAVDGSERSRSLAIRDTLENPDQVALDASAERTDLLLRDSVDVTALAIDAADSIDADNSLEKMLAHQMAAAHKASFEIMDKALTLLAKIDGTTNPKLVQLLSTEATRLMNASARMMQSYQQGMTTLQKVRSGGNQTMTVQHVNVSDGGQALIGNVAGASGERKNK